ncbi:unnamed protein product [Amoebophrya sp. A120]|nr:unnamed protein product [Amoebophrya sp. A120]|eukprot:GSA120T00002057001.1
MRKCFGCLFRSAPCRLAVLEVLLLVTFQCSFVPRHIGPVSGAILLPTTEPPRPVPEPIDIQGGHQDVKECPFCLEPIEDGDDIIADCPACETHVMHYRCATSAAARREQQAASGSSVAPTTASRGVFSRSPGAGSARSNGASSSTTAAATGFSNTPRSELGEDDRVAFSWYQSLSRRRPIAAHVMDGLMALMSGGRRSATTVTGDQTGGTPAEPSASSQLYTRLPLDQVQNLPPPPAFRPMSPPVLPPMPVFAGEEFLDVVEQEAHNQLHAAGSRPSEEGDHGGPESSLPSPRQPYPLQRSPRSAVTHEATPINFAATADEQQSTTSTMLPVSTGADGEQTPDFIPPDGDREVIVDIDDLERTRAPPGTPWLTTRAASPTAAPPVEEDNAGFLAWQQSKTSAGAPVSCPMCRCTMHLYRGRRLHVRSGTSIAGWKVKPRRSQRQVDHDGTEGRAGVADPGRPNTSSSASPNGSPGSARTSPGAERSNLVAAAASSALGEAWPYDVVTSSREGSSLRLFEGNSTSRPSSQNQQRQAQVVQQARIDQLHRFPIEVGASTNLSGSSTDGTTQVTDRMIAENATFQRRWGEETDKIATPLARVEIPSGSSGVVVRIARRGNSSALEEQRQNEMRTGSGASPTTSNATARVLTLADALAAPIILAFGRNPFGSAETRVPAEVNATEYQPMVAAPLVSVLSSERLSEMNASPRLADVRADPFLYHEAAASVASQESPPGVNGPPGGRVAPAAPMEVDDHLDPFFVRRHQREDQRDRAARDRPGANPAGRQQPGMNYRWTDAANYLFAFDASPKPGAKQAPATQPPEQAEAVPPRGPPESTVRSPRGTAAPPPHGVIVKFAHLDESVFVQAEELNDSVVLELESAGNMDARAHDFSMLMHYLRTNPRRVFFLMYFPPLVLFAFFFLIDMACTSTVLLAGLRPMKMPLRDVVFATGVAVRDPHGYMQVLDQRKPEDERLNFWDNFELFIGMTPPDYRSYFPIRHGSFTLQPAEVAERRRWAQLFRDAPYLYGLLDDSTAVAFREAHEKAPRRNPHFPAHAESSSEQVLGPYAAYNQAMGWVGRPEIWFIPPEGFKGEDIITGKAGTDVDDKSGIRNRAQEDNTAPSASARTAQEDTNVAPSGKTTPFPRQILTKELTLAPVYEVLNSWWQTELAVVQWAAAFEDGDAYVNKAQYCRELAYGPTVAVRDYEEDLAVHFQKALKIGDEVTTSDTSTSDGGNAPDHNRSARAARVGEGTSSARDSSAKTEEDRGGASCETLGQLWRACEIQKEESPSQDEDRSDENRRKVEQACVRQFSGEKLPPWVKDISLSQMEHKILSIFWAGALEAVPEHLVLKDSKFFQMSAPPDPASRALAEEGQRGKTAANREQGQARNKSLLQEGRGLQERPRTPDSSTPRGQQAFLNKNTSSQAPAASRQLSAPADQRAANSSVDLRPLHNLKVDLSDDEKWQHALSVSLEHWNREWASEKPALVLRRIGSALQTEVCDATHVAQVERLVTQVEAVLDRTCCKIDQFRRLDPEQEHAWVRNTGPVPDPHILLAEVDSSCLCAQLDVEAYTHKVRETLVEEEREEAAKLERSAERVAERAEELLTALQKLRSDELKKMVAAEKTIHDEEAATGPSGGHDLHPAQSSLGTTTRRLTAGVEHDLQESHPRGLASAIESLAEGEVDPVAVVAKDDVAVGDLSADERSDAQKILDEAKRLKDEKPHSVFGQRLNLGSEVQPPPHITFARKVDRADRMSRSGPPAGKSEFEAGRWGATTATSSDRTAWVFEPLRHNQDRNWNWQYSYAPDNAELPSDYMEYFFRNFLAPDFAAIPDARLRYQFALLRRIADAMASESTYETRHTFWSETAERRKLRQKLYKVFEKSQYTWFRTGADVLAQGENNGYAKTSTSRMTGLDAQLHWLKPATEVKTGESNSTGSEDDEETASPSKMALLIFPHDKPLDYYTTWKVTDLATPGFTRRLRFDSLAAFLAIDNPDPFADTDSLNAILFPLMWHISGTLGVSEVMAYDHLHNNKELDSVTQLSASCLQMVNDVVNHLDLKYLPRIGVFASQFANKSERLREFRKFVEAGQQMPRANDTGISASTRAAAGNNPAAASPRNAEIRIDFAEVESTVGLLGLSEDEKSEGSHRNKNQGLLRKDRLLEGVLAKDRGHEHTARNF